VIGKTQLTRHQGLSVIEITGKGRGLIATSDIADGDVIEVAPVIPLTDADGDIRESVLFNYPFKWDDPPHIEAIALGAISMCNHDDDPNAVFEPDIPAGVMRLWALRAIAAGEEITIDYGIPLWFEASS
jgi:SET domain-containing protein